jgi:hypothetical protein
VKYPSLKIASPDPLVSQPIFLLTMDVTKKASSFVAFGANQRKGFLWVAGDRW